MKVILTKSKRAGKKYAARVGNKTIHFGAQGYENVTTHKYPKRKANYLARIDTKIGTTQQPLDIGPDTCCGTKTR